jgi:hypothetical protein
MNHEARARDVLKDLPREYHTAEIIKELVLWSMDNYAIGLNDGKSIGRGKK